MPQDRESQFSHDIRLEGSFAPLLITARYVCEEQNRFPFPFQRDTPCRPVAKSISHQKSLREGRLTFISINVSLVLPPCATFSPTLKLNLGPVVSNVNKSCRADVMKVVSLHCKGFFLLSQGTNELFFIENEWCSRALSSCWLGRYTTDKVLLVPHG